LIVVEAVMDGVNSEEWAKLDDAERIAYCRTAALAAEACAQSPGDVGMREMNKRLAAQWHSLAEKIERGEGPPRNPS